MVLGRMRVVPVRWCVVMVAALVAGAQLAVANFPKEPRLPEAGLIGSVWMITYEGADIPRREVEVTLFPRGRMSFAHPNDKTPENDTWEVRDGKLLLKPNDAYAVYEGVIRGGMYVAGTAKNVKDKTWKWHGTRIR